MKTYKNILWRRVRLIIMPVVAFVSVLSTGCSDSVADAPQIKVFVNGIEYVGSGPLEFTVNDVIHYRFEITAFTTIADVKLIEYDILNEEVKIPTERIVGGLTNGRKEVVEGYAEPVSDTEYRLVVKDTDGNEVSNGFTYYII